MLPVIFASLVILFTTASVYAADSLRLPGEERHLMNINMLTYGGENAEAYFSHDGNYICWQGHWAGNYQADQIFTMPSGGGDPKLLSTGFGKTTCSFFIPGTDRVIYCSTHGHSKDPPDPVDFSSGYVWTLDEYDVYSVNRDGTGLKRLTDAPGYDAEAAVSPDGRKIVFTSMRDGDLDIYTMDIDGSNLKKLTNTLGYDGGPFFSLDGDWIVFRSHLPATDGEVKRYKALIAERKVSPMRFELQIMRADGSERRQITDLGVASFAPYMHPDGKRIIFCSNYEGSRPLSDDIPANHREEGGAGSGEGRQNPSTMPVFNLWMVNIDGTGLEPVTHNPSFDGFPMFSFDGRKLIWCSNRFGPEPRSTNIFTAEWVD